MVLNRLIILKRHQLRTFRTFIDNYEQVNTALMPMSLGSYCLIVRLTGSEPSFGKSFGFDTTHVCRY